MFWFWLIFVREKYHLIIFNIVIEKEHWHSQKKNSSACLKLFFFYQRCWSILYSFSELMHSDQTLEYKRLNFSANYMPEGTLTMQVSMLC